MMKKELYEKAVLAGKNPPPYDDITAKELEALLAADNGGGAPGGDGPGNQGSGGNTDNGGNIGGDGPGNNNGGGDNDGGGDDQEQKIPALEFASNGWCEKLNRSYWRGRYQPQSKEEYEALKPFGKEV